MTPGTMTTPKRSATRTLAWRAIWVAALAVVPACSSVDQGEPPADINACRPSQTFFVDMVFPNFLTKDYAGKTCGDANCHTKATLRAPVVFMPSTTMPAIPLAGGSEWETLYRSATEVMICTDVLGSDLFTRPAGLQTHAPGRLIDPSPAGPEALLLQQWVMARP